ncbi:MAG: helix-turn-helix transcriptional regulator [Eubacterium sp.]|nr:helix-turn-helix transcriptional regulator [Eubacterium sp.]
MDAKRTGKIINSKRKEKGLTQIQLAEILNVSNRAVSKWENGDGFPDITLLPDIAKALDITIDELLTGVKPEPEIIEIEKSQDINAEKKSRAKFLISEIIAFSLAFASNVIGGVLELKLFNVRPFYVFIEIYLLVLCMILFVVSLIIFFTGFVKYSSEIEKIKNSSYLEVYLFTIFSLIMPVFALFRILHWYNLFVFYIYILACILILVLFSVFMFKKIKGSKNE